MWRPSGQSLNPALALQPHIIPKTGVKEPIFNNARPYAARVSQDCLLTVSTLPWPPRSPDLSPIEHNLDHLGR
ncbi:hypothetical protein TNCV_5046841 [Trichonephila clavipes]|nr:hypothetical protein TNCV_5046841 [Trichonephila clavipes]